MPINIVKLSLPVRLIHLTSHELSLCHSHHHTPEKWTPYAPESEPVFGVDIKSWSNGVSHLMSKPLSEGIWPPIQCPTSGGPSPVEGLEGPHLPHTPARCRRLVYPGPNWAE